MKFKLHARIFILSFFSFFFCGTEYVPTKTNPQEMLLGSWVDYESRAKVCDSSCNSPDSCVIKWITIFQEDHSLWFSCTLTCSSPQAESALVGLQYQPKANGSWYIISDSLIMTPSYKWCYDSNNQVCSTITSRLSYSLLKVTEDSLLLGYWNDCTDLLFGSPCKVGTDTKIWTRYR